MKILKIHTLFFEIGKFAIWFCFLSGIGLVHAQVQPPLSLSKEGKLVYAADSMGNHIPDFSHAGYAGGNVAIPKIASKIFVPVQNGDATAKIQAAIDYVAKLPLDKNGFRGAVQLGVGEYKVSGSLKIQHSGIILRGAGFGNDGTTILGTGFTRETLLQIHGENNVQLTDSTAIIDQYTPVGSLKITLNPTSVFKVGDRIQITRPATAEWINALGTDHFGGGITSLGWKPGQREIYWDRMITEIEDGVITLDAPLTTALDHRFGGGYVQKINWPGEIQHVGVEGLRLMSTYDKNNLKDEDHRWMAITLANISNGWVRQVEFHHFAGSAVYALSSASKVTVEDCISLDPISEIAGQRRRTFFTNGQQILFQRCYSENGYHDFAVGFMAAGPNAFVQCQAIGSLDFSGAVDSWASGVLFDVVQIEDNALSFKNRGQDGQGAGWSAANSVFWQSTASLIENFQPPTAQNWAFGTWSQFQGNGYWDQSNEHIKPRSLYYAQLEERLGPEIANRKILLPVLSEASSSPSVEVAAALTKEALHPTMQLIDFIRNAATRTPIAGVASPIKSIDEIDWERPEESKTVAPLLLKAGLLQRNNAIQVGQKTDVQWWSGNARRYATAKSKVHVTRFVPGEEGMGLTDNLDEVADFMQRNHILVLDHNYGLWYDRRRDDHERIRRIDGDVWPPFYELPFARTGQGTAYDGLSKYDLTKYNHFYWDRLGAFAKLADEHQLILIYQHYFQHNILEAGAHYTEFPWRTANNINEVGFPEPAPYAGDKRIFMAEQFYDVNNTTRRAIHRSYIRKSLDNFKNSTGVIHSISAEYTGPLHFVEFWIDVIKEWKAETGKNPLISLSTTKDVQDAILNDPIRSKEVQVIDIRYWHYQADGSVYAPLGGQNLAPRQHARLMKPKKTSPEQVYRAVSEYRTKFPDKAVVYHSSNYPEMAWAIFMAGGSMAGIPNIEAENFEQEAASMKPENLNGLWVLENTKGKIIYAENSVGLVDLVKDLKGKFTVTYIDPKTGATLAKETNNAKNLSLNPTILQHAVVLWISK